MGLAVFDGAKMVGVLDGAETMAHLMVEVILNIVFHFARSNERRLFCAFRYWSGRAPKRKVEMVNGVPNITVDVF